MSRHRKAQTTVGAPVPGGGLTDFRPPELPGGLGGGRRRSGRISSANQKINSIGKPVPTRKVK